MKPAWHADAACRDLGPTLWFPERGQPPTDAQAICGACAVRQQCLTAAMDDPTLAGIWGGTTKRERQRLRTAS